MPKTIAEIQAIQKRAKEAHDEMVRIDEKAAEEKRDLTEEEQARFDELKTAVQSDQNELTRAKELGEQSRLFQREIISMQPHDNGDDDPNGGFESMGEFVRSVFNAKMRGVFDERLKRHLERANILGDGPSGGFMVPPNYSEQMLTFLDEASPYRGWSTVLPRSTTGAPDAPYQYSGWDQSSGRYAGVSIHSAKEVTALTDAQKSKTNQRMVTMNPAKQIAESDVGNDLLRNTTGFEGRINDLFRRAMVAWEGEKFLFGTGSGEPLGVTKSAAVQPITRATANEISFADVANMRKLIFPGARMAWVASQDAMPQILQLKDDNGNSIYIAGDITRGIRESVFGIPLEFNSDLPDLGAENDLLLVNWEHYWIQDGSQLIINFDSGGINFSKDQTVFQMLFWVDAKSQLNKPIPARNSSATYKMGIGSRLK